METTEKIVEAYVRYVKGWATIPNIKCSGGLKEIDILAIDPVNLNRYHIEISVSISRSYSKITSKPYDPVLRKQRGKTAQQRVTLGFFVEDKFEAPEVLKSLKKYGFQDNNYEKILVAWDWDDGVPNLSQKESITLWRFPDLLNAVMEKFENIRSYHTDDTVRTLQLIAFTRSKQGSGSQKDGEEK
jgi:hypothetical protein